MLIKQENIFQKIFYISHCLVVLSTGQAVASQPKECQMKKCLSHSEKPVKHLTFGLQLTAQCHAALWGHSKV